VRAHLPRGFSAATAALALGLPLAAGVALVSVLEWGWLIVAGVLLLGSTGMLVTWLGEGRRGEEPAARSSAAASELLRRLCMRADMRVPGLVVAPGPVAIAWTAGGRIHVSRPLLELLDDAELEAVLAHELAHLAHRDAVVMEICSAPSRVLLAFAGLLARWSARGIRSYAMALPGGGMVMAMLVGAAALCVPPAFVIGWVSRLSVLGISRAREFSADAAAATLTGRPSALASALLKLDRQREWTPRSDLRQVEAYAVLCIVGARSSRLGRLFSTHPPTATRVKRLGAIETRLQTAWRRRAG
jgi:heat shock protein HtpX